MKSKSKLFLIDAIICFILIILDQISKIAITPLKNGNPIEIINNVFEITYLENYGAAFGMLQNQRILFFVISIIVFGVIGYILYKLPNDKKYIKLNLILIFILSGAIGNLIDRIYLGYVRDFLYFKLIDFPVFNVADCYITCATILLVILIMFCYSEEELSFLSKKNKK